MKRACARPSSCWRPGDAIGTLKSSDFDAKYWPKAKRQLRRETHDKCAYCEAPTSSVAPGSVEHFRPKSRYWWLAYCYDNYLFACQRCNGDFKSDEFPIAGRRLTEPALTSAADLSALGAGMAPDPLDPASVAKHVRAWAAERPLPIDPSLEDPEPLFAWEYDDVLREVRVKPRGRGQRAERASRCIELFGLNREELCVQRWATLAPHLVTLDALATLPARQARTLRERERLLLGDDAPFAAMLRFVVSAKLR